MLRDHPHVVSSQRRDSDSPSKPVRKRQRTIRVYDDGQKWDFAGQRRRISDDGEPVAHPSDLVGCTAADLRAALVRNTTWFGLSAELQISDGSPQHADVEDGPIGPVSFLLDRDNQLRMRLIHASSPSLDDDALLTHVERILTPLLERRRLWLLSTEDLGGVGGADDCIIGVELGFHTRGRDLADLLAIGFDALALLDAADSGELGREQVADLLRSGHASAFIGQVESSWLEAKRQHYDLTSITGKIALAQAVARFANAEDGGLIVVGLETKTSASGDDVIRRVSPTPHDPRIVRRYQSVLQERLYPPPDGLGIERVATSAGDLILIDVPPQPEDLKPFLVHGAVVGGKVEGAFISIVRRRGDGSIPTTAPMIHATLVAGRALLRRGVLPADDHVQT
jgi:hypothetical protein